MKTHFVGEYLLVLIVSGKHLSTFIHTSYCTNKFGFALNLVL